MIGIFCGRAPIISKGVEVVVQTVPSPRCPRNGEPDAPTSSCSAGRSPKAHSKRTGVEEGPRSESPNNVLDLSCDLKGGN